MRDEEVHNGYVASHYIFKTITESACVLSVNTAGRMVSSRREQIASIIFGKVALHAYTILQISPSGHQDRGDYPSALPDIASLFVLARALMEGYCTLYYIAVEDISDEERDFRILICDYHALKKRVDFLESLDLTPPDLPQLKIEVEALKTNIERHSLFSMAPEKKKILKGEKTFLYTNTDIAKKAGINPNIHKSVYDYLSNYSHGFPLSLEQVFALSSIEDAYALMSPILTISNAYLHFAIRDYVKVFPDQRDFVDAKAKYGLFCCEEKFGIKE